MYFILFLTTFVKNNITMNILSFTDAEKYLQNKFTMNINKTVWIPILGLFFAIIDINDIYILTSEYYLKYQLMCFLLFLLTIIF